jgi:hypothetical protein
MEYLEKTRERFFLGFKGEVLDLGCGKMQYATNMLNKSKEFLELFGFDILKSFFDWANLLRIQLVLSSGSDARTRFIGRDSGF